MASSNSVYTPGGAGGLQGIKCQAGDPLDVNGTTVKTGDISKTRITGGLGHATLHSKTPSSGHTFRDDRHGGRD